MNKGKLGESALKRSVLNRTAEYNKKAVARIGADAGFFEVGDKKMLMSSASVSGSDKGNGELCVVRAVNSMAAAGGTPCAAAVTFVVPKEAPEEYAKRMSDEVVRACKVCNVNLVSGNTLIGEEACVSAVVTGEKKFELSPPGKEEARVLIMTGFAGSTGAAMLAEKRLDALAERLTHEFIHKAIADFSNIGSFEKAYAIASNCKGKTAMHDISEGGVFGALWELLEREDAGCIVNLKDIPIRQSTVEVCEILNVSPYQLRGDGGLLAIVEDTPENRALGKVIGTVDNTADRVVVNGEEKRFLEPNRFDGYYEI